MSQLWEGPVLQPRTRGAGRAVSEDKTESGERWCVINGVGGL